METKARTIAEGLIVTMAAGLLFAAQSISSAQGQAQIESADPASHSPAYVIHPKAETVRSEQGKEVKVLRLLEPGQKATAKKGRKKKKADFAELNRAKSNAANPPEVCYPVRDVGSRSTLLPNDVAASVEPAKEGFPTNESLAEIAAERAQRRPIVTRPSPARHAIKAKQQK